MLCTNFDDHKVEVGVKGSQNAPIDVKLSFKSLHGITIF